MFKRVLCVKKTTKYERLKATGLLQSSYVENVLMKTWQEAANIHITVADAIIQAFKDSGRQVQVARDYQLVDKDFDDKDLIVSLGGDGTFLKTASMVKTRTLPIFGINTDPSRSVGHLTSHKIPYEYRNKEIPQLMDYIQRENFKYIYKQRIMLEKKDSETNKSIKKTYALNEVFVSERNVGASSIYRLKADGQYIGKFKSSGLLMCTGTGSTGWLQSAKRTTDGDVLAGLDHLGFSREGEAVVHGIALDLSKRTAFDLSRPELFYYVREPQISGDYERHAQGFAKNLEFVSELYDGMVSVDGLLSVQIGLGEHFICDVKPEYALKSLQFLI